MNKDLSVYITYLGEVGPGVGGYGIEIETDTTVVDTFSKTCILRASDGDYTPGQRFLLSEESPFSRAVSLSFDGERKYLLFYGAALSCSFALRLQDLHISFAKVEFQTSRGVFVKDFPIWKKDTHLRFLTEAEDEILHFNFPFFPYKSALLELNQYIAERTKQIYMMMDA